MSERTAHRDTFARDNLPAAADWPVMTFTLPELQYPGRLNCATELLDKMASSSHAPRPCVWFGSKL
ncbi:MAG: 2-aminobenzoate-CoA ligase, partial [Alphaproteobacteria bacterium]|nr:2-aminobenzoate-CoA ligase [Alphaproteobacteria bacterium]